MGPAERRIPGVWATAATVTRATGTSAARRGAPAMTSGGWETRLPAALRLPGIADGVQAREIAALGTVGVEAEFFLRLLRDFPGRGPYTRAHGAAFLAQLAAWANRMVAAGAPLEVATQGFLAALDASFPSLRTLSATSATGATGGDAEVWWAPLPPLVLGGEPLELRLRRCGFAYRHVVAVQLASTVETLAEHLAQVLQALLTLPPAGVLPAATLYGGLSELTATVQGYLIPYLLVARDPRTPGLLPAIARLRQLDTTDPPILANDIAWAQAQYAAARAVLIQARMTASTPRASARPALLPGVLRDWQATIATLEALDTATSARLRAARSH